MAKKASKTDAVKGRPAGVNASVAKATKSTEKSKTTGNGNLKDEHTLLKTKVSSKTNGLPPSGEKILKEMHTVRVNGKLNLRASLQEYFGFDNFKGAQEKIIQSVMNGEDTFVIMPTGGGKSLCYQLPAILLRGTAIIISPLIALMKNQVDQIRGYSSNDNIAHFLNSSLTKKQLKRKLTKKKLKEKLLNLQDKKKKKKLEYNWKEQNKNEQQMRQLHW